MSNEHPSQVGPSAVDRPFDEAGYDLDEGPLDPSVFFGLFDDLVDDTESDTTTTDQPEPAMAGGASVEHKTAATRQATVGRWSAAPDEQPANGREGSVPSPPPIPPEVREARIAETGEPFAADDPGEATTTGSPPPPDLERRIDEAVDRGSPPVPEGAVGRGDGTMAKAALGTIAVGLFAGLVVTFVLSLRSPDPALSGAVEADPAASSAVEGTPTGLAGAIATGTRPTIEMLNEEFTTTLSTAMRDRLDLTSLRFQPGTTELDETSSEVIVALGAMLAEQPAAPVTISVRTYTESTPAANLALSSDQADSLVTTLVAAGANPDRIRARGLGASPLSQAQPVPNFVALTPQFGDRRLHEALADRSHFALGVPATATAADWPLRPDGLPLVGELAETLSALPDVEVGAAGYSFLPPSQAGIRSEADTAVIELMDFLAAAYDVDAEKINTIIPGSAVFVPTPDHGNHVWLQVGPASQGAFDVASIDPAAITFEAGTADLDAAGLAAVEALAEVLISGGATIVVDVRSYEAADVAANQALSEARRDVLTGTLVDAGVAPEQLRMYASGASSYLLDDGGPAITITVVP